MYYFKFINVKYAYFYLQFTQNQKEIIKLILSLELMLLGIFTLIYITVILAEAITIIAKYFEFKDNKPLLYIGLSSIGLATPWSGVAANFISVVFFDVTISMELYFLLHGTYIPISIFFWIVGCLYLSNIRSTTRKMIIIITGVLYAIFEIIYIIIIFTDTSILGTPLNEIQVDYAIFSEIFLLCAIIQTIVLGLWMGKRAIRSHDKRIQLQGKFLLTCFSLFAFVAFIEVMIPIIFILILARILVIFTSILFYGGFILPKWMEKLFLRKEDSGFLEESTELKDNVQDFLKIFSQRRDVTAKEVTVYREKKICLVCRGKVGGFNNYICTKCDALYCEKCARALTRLENACWACNEAIDKSQPVRKFESEQEAIELLHSTEAKKMPKKKYK